MSDDDLPAPLAAAVDDEEIDPELVSKQLSLMGEKIEESTEETSVHNLCYAQAHDLERASELLLELYAEQNEYGEREAEMLALALALERQAGETV